MDAIYINTRIHPWVSAVSISVAEVSTGKQAPYKTTQKGLVMRFAATIGTLSQMAEKQMHLDGPVLVDTRGFAGYINGAEREVHVLGSEYLHRFPVFGLCGFPDMGGSGSLRRITTYEVAVLAGGCSFSRVETHRNMNAATASACFLGARTLARLQNPGNLLVYSCQCTNQTEIVKIVPEDHSIILSLSDLPEEHRKDIFSVQNNSD